MSDERRRVGGVLFGQEQQGHVAELDIKVSDAQWEDVNRLWRFINRERARLIEGRCLGKLTPEENARLNELQAVADGHLSAAAPHDEGTLKQLENELGILTAEELLDKLWRVMQSHNPVITLNLTSDGWCRIENGDTDEVLGEGPTLTKAIADIEEKQTMTKKEHAVAMELVEWIQAAGEADKSPISLRRAGLTDLPAALNMLDRAMNLITVAHELGCFIDDDDPDTTKLWGRASTLVRDWNGE